jgi:hypothetical protein
MAARPRMKVQSIRFALKEWQDIQDAAEQAGVSASQYVRNAARAVALLDNAEQAKELRAMMNGLNQTSPARRVSAGQGSPPSE